MSSNLLTLICNANCPANTANPGASKYPKCRALGSRNRSECGICGSTPERVPKNGKPPFGHLDSSGNSTGDPTPRSLNQIPEPDLGFKGLEMGVSQIRAPFWGVPIIGDYNIVGAILGSPYCGKRQNSN